MKRDNLPPIRTNLTSLIAAAVTMVNFECLPATSVSQQLQELRTLRGDTNMSFAAVSGLAGRLERDALPTLAREIGTGRTDGMSGWVRAAVFAEWGKRDFMAAMHQLWKSAHLDSGHNQALYAVFRGSRPSEPAEALLHLQRMFKDHSSAVGAFTRGWAKRALREVFSEMTTTQPEKTWQILASD